MNKQIAIALALLVSLSGIAVYLASNDSSKNNDLSSQQNYTEQESDVATRQNCLSEDCLKIEDLEYPVDELPAEVVSALNAAIDDEYKAHATYEAVIDELGSTRPFSMIIRAEEKHISSLKSIFDKYGLDIPADPYTDIEVSSSKAENCAVGVQAEIDNAALYQDKLLPAVTEYSDITSVFTSLMNASQDNHLPAFERCAS